MTLNTLSHQPTMIPTSAVDAGLTAEPGSAGFYQPVDIHRALDEVRRMPEFEPVKPSWLDEVWKQPWLKKLSQQVGDALHHVLKAIWDVLSHVKPPGMSHLPENIRSIFSGFTGFLLVLAGLFVLYILLGWLMRWRERQLPVSQPQPRMLEEVVLVNSEHHYQQARQEAEKGDYESALKHLYMAMLCLLDERKLAPYEATRTNLEYLALLEQAKALRTAGPQSGASLKACFTSLARQFEAARYGLQPVTPGQFEHSRGDYEAMVQLVAGKAL